MINKIWDTFKNASRWRRVAWGAWLVFFIVGGIFVLYPYGYVFFEKGNLEAIRNIVLIVAALLAFPLTLERMIIADGQLKATEKQIAQARKEAENAKKEAKMQKTESDFERWHRDLSSGDEKLKEYAINELWKLAKNQPKECHIRVMNILSRSIEGSVFHGHFYVAKKEALKRLINQGNLYKNAEQKEEERRNKYRICLRNCQLYDMDLSNGDLRGVDLSWSSLSQANFSNSILTKASFKGTEMNGITQLDGTDLSHVDFSWSQLHEVNLSRTNLTGAIFEKTFMTRVDLEGNTTIEKANWRGIVMEVQEHPIVSSYPLILSNLSLRQRIMNKSEKKPQSEWEGERRKIKEAELNKIRQSQKSSS